MQILQRKEHCDWLKYNIRTNQLPQSAGRHIEVCEWTKKSNKEPTAEIKSAAFLPYIKGLSELLRRCLQ